MTDTALPATGRCESCGMPIDSGQYCDYCTDENGALQDFDTRFAAMAAWQQRRHPGSSAEDIARATREYMASLPAWKDHPKLVVDGGGSASW